MVVIVPHSTSTSVRSCMDFVCTKINDLQTECICKPEVTHPMSSFELYFWSTIGILVVLMLIYIIFFYGNNDYDHNSYY